MGVAALGLTAAVTGLELLCVLWCVVCGSAFPASLGESVCGVCVWGGLWLGFRGGGGGVLL